MRLAARRLREIAAAVSGMPRDRRNIVPGSPADPGTLRPRSRQGGKSCRPSRPWPLTVADSRRHRPRLGRADHRPGDPADLRRLLRLPVADAARPLRHHGDLGGHPRRRALSGLRRACADCSAAAADWRRPSSRWLGPVVVVVPLGAVTVNVAETTVELVSDFENQTVAVPRPPESVREWPVIGEKVHAAWTPRLRQPRGRGQALRAAAAEGGRDDRRQGRRHRLRDARLCRVGADRRLPLRPRPSTRGTGPRSSPAASPPSAGRASSTWPGRRSATSRAA